VHRSSRLAVSLVLLASLAFAGCAGGHRQFAALSRVHFEFSGVSDVRLVGIRIDDQTASRRLGFADMARLTAAMASGEVPLELTAHLGATNPVENPVAARIVNVSWSLYIDDRHAMDGGLAAPVAIAPGRTGDVPLAVRLDLAELSHGGARDLYDLAVAIAGQGTVGKPLRLVLRPTIETPIGPIRYPYPVVVERLVEPHAAR
jgi:hypothetical protein